MLRGREGKKEIKDMQAEKKEAKLSLSADDMALYIENPTSASLLLPRFYNVYSHFLPRFLINQKRGTAIPP